MIAPVDHLIVKTKLSEKNQVQFKNLTLDLQSFDHLKNAVTHGEVVAIPRKLSDVAFTGRSEGLPRYSDPRDIPRDSAIRMNHIVPMVEVGDIAHFNYKVCQEENLIDFDGECFYYKCLYNLVYAVVRYGTSKGKYFNMDSQMVFTTQIIPVGSYVLLKPVMETEDEIRHPVPGLPKKKWLWIKPQPGKKYLTATVEHMGIPLTSDPDFDLGLGDVVFLRKFADKEIEIDGTTYYPVRMKDIEFKYVNDVSNFVA